MIKYFYVNNIYTDNATTRFDEKNDADLCAEWNGLTINLLQDIYDVHRCFIFTNYHFIHYSLEKYINNINQNGFLSKQFTSKYFKNVKFDDSFPFNPYYIINDDMFRIITYFHGISLFVNNIRTKIKYNDDDINNFKLTFFVIAKSIKCVFGDDIAYNYNIGKITQYFRP